MDDRSTCTQGAAGHTKSRQGHDTVDAGASQHVSVQEDVTVHGIDPTTDATLALRDVSDNRNGCRWRGAS